MVTEARAAGPVRPGWSWLGALTAYWLGLAVLWGALTTVILPRLVELAVPAGVKTTALALIAGLQAVIAIVVQPVSGAASDRLTSRWGRRRPLLAVGVAVQLVCLAVLALATGYWAVLGAMLLVEFWSDVAQGPYQGLLPDLVPAGERSLESGLMGGATLAGQVIGVAAAGVAVAAGLTPLAIVLCGLVLGLTTLVTLLGVREEAGRVAPLSRTAAGGLASDESASTVPHPVGWLRHLLHPARWARPLRRVVVEVWDRDVLKRHDYVWLLAARLLILMATGTLQPFVYFYLEDSLGLGDRAAVAVAPLAGTVALVALVSAVVTVSLSTRLGLARTVSLSAVAGAVGAVLFAVAPTYPLLFFIALPFGLALGVFLSADWALLVDVVPLDEAGRYLGLSNTVTAAAGLLAVALGGPLADVVNGWRFGWGYRAIFVLAALEFALGALCMRRVHEPASNEDTPFANQVATSAGEAAPSPNKDTTAAPDRLPR